jgi:hypothetical protein
MRKINKRQKYVLFFCSIAATILLVFIFGAKLFKEADEKSYQEFRETFGKNVYGYQLGFTNPDYGPMGEKLIWNLENNNLELVFTNASTDGEFLLKIFWDFEEIEFSIDNEEADNQYIFTSNYSETKNWKVSFPEELSKSSEDYLGSLTAIVFIEPNVHQKDAAIYDHKNYGLAIVQHVFSKESFDSFDPNHLFTKASYQTFEEYDTAFNDLNVTTLEDDLLSNPSSSLKVASGEMIKLNFLAGASIEEINDYVLIAVLGNKQVSLNGQNRLPLHLAKDPLSGKITPQTGMVEFPAPDEPGNYEFIMYQFPLSSEMLGLSMVENSFRITIVVE